MIKAIATDLDGTLIPLHGDPVQQTDLRILAEEIQRRNWSLAFVTGRHAESAIAAIDEHSLPRPEVIICNVGTTIIRLEADAINIDQDYAMALRTLTGGVTSVDLQRWLSGIPELRIQEDFKQAEFKLSYYISHNVLSETSAAVKAVLQQYDAPWDIIVSVDPFNGDGLLDILPVGVSKSFAIESWGRGLNLQSSELVFAGDSGNDIAALTAGWKAILVGNATPDVVAQTKRLSADAGHQSTLYHSHKSASSGVLDGVRYFLAES